jgi:thiopurine S-methyltransferase
MRTFFKEQRLNPVRSRVGRLTLWQAGAIGIPCGDYFAMPSSSSSRSCRVSMR